MTIVLEVVDNPRLVAARTALQAVQHAIHQRGRADVAFTGGVDGTAAAKEFLSGLAETDIDRSLLHFWWADERFISFGHELRNDKPILEEIDRTLSLGGINLHPAPEPTKYSDVQSAAEMYAQEIHDVTLDVAILGVGADGHIASIFGTDASRDDIADVLGVCDSPKYPAQRLTLSLRRLSEAEVLIVVATSAEKMTAIRQALDSSGQSPLCRLTQMTTVKLIIGRPVYVMT